MPNRGSVVNDLVEQIEATLAVDSEYANIPLDLVQYVVHLLKEQEPVVPYDKPLGYYRCGNCGTHVHKYGEQDKYCPGCGRAVKWDE